MPKNELDLFSTVSIQYRQVTDRPGRVYALYRCICVTQKKCATETSYASPT